MSDIVTLTHEDHVSTITFDYAPFNLLDIGSMDALIEAHKEADANPDTRVMITRSGIEGMYSNGVSPMAIIEGDAETREATFAAVGRLIHEIYALDKPHITVVNGPAMAGGAVLAILADWRYFVEGAGEISFAETKVGVPVPSSVSDIVATVCNPSALNDIILMAQRCDAKTALDVGLANVIAPADQIEGLVAKHVQRIARMSPGVLRRTKTQLRADVRAKTIRTMEGGMEPLRDFLTDDYLGEGLKAFMEGRAPVFKK